MNALFLNFASKAKRVYTVSLYRSSSEKDDELDNFLFSFELFLCDIAFGNPSFVLVIDNSNARATKWWRNEMITVEGAKIELHINFYNLIQIISDPTHILPNSFSSIDFILQTNLTWLLKVGFTLCPSNCFCET